MRKQSVPYYTMEIAHEVARINCLCGPRCSQGSILLPHPCIQASPKAFVGESCQTGFIIHAPLLQQTGGAIIKATCTTSALGFDTKMKM